jgi:multicomponent Na+:H+ antiporter subunit D
MTALYLPGGRGGARSSIVSKAVRPLGPPRPPCWPSLALFFAGSDLLLLSGFWPKAMLVKASLDIGAWCLAGAILVSGFLTTIAFGRLFLLAYWRPAPVVIGKGGEAAIQTAAPRASRSAMLPILALTALVVWFGLFPEPLIDLSQRAAIGLADPAAYLQSVFPVGGQP